jgi:probable rRNA maturation factor
VSATVDIAMDSPLWADVPMIEKVVRGAVEAALSECTIEKAEVGVALTDDARVRELNRQWRGHDMPTNVLSFPAPEIPAENGRFLGDVILAFETIRREAELETKPIAHHVAHLAVHGTLHLLGFDHEADADAERMERRERDILARLGIPDPYEPASTRRTELA